VITCPKCGKENNQDHYRYCLGCGAFLPRPGDDGPSAKTQTPPTGIPTVGQDDTVDAFAEDNSVREAFPDLSGDAPSADVVEDAILASESVSRPGRPSPPPDPEPDPPHGEATPCLSCGNLIPDGFAFCGACGAPVPGAGSPARAAVSSQAAATTSARLVLIQPDGTEGGHVDIPGTDVAVGRDAGGFFANDPFLSPAHAVFRASDKSVAVRDAGSLNGTFVKITPNAPVEIHSGDIFRIGQELILFEEIDMGSDAPDGTVKMGSPIEGLWGRAALIVGNGRLGNAFTLSGEGVVLGRERGDIVFPEDGYVSGIHLKLYTEKGRYYLNDLGSSNGTFLRLSEECELPAGSFLLMGQQLFRIDL
jgi:pSer/pThr/pTyr-binding forkhead associated (FHA) protein